MNLDKDAWPSSGLLGVNVACARESSQGCFHFSWHYLAGNPSHVGANVDELARSLQHPMVCDKQMRVQNFVMGIAMSCRAVVGGGACPEVRSPLGWIFNMVLTVWIPEGSNLTWRSLLLPGRACPALDLSWQFCMFLWWISYVRQRWDGSQYSSAYCHAHMGDCGHILLHQALNAAASQDPSIGKAYPVLKTLK
jgi:hypothetical protein